jgi:uncharacterized protein (TIRG00374 family)
MLSSKKNQGGDCLMDIFSNDHKFNAANLGRILKILLIIIPLAVAGNIVYVIIATEPGIINHLNNFNGWFLALAVTLAFLPWLAQSSRILIWGKVFKKNIKPGQAFKTVLATEMGAAITPTMLGGSYAKLGFLIGYGFTVAEATLVTFLGTLVDAVFFAFALPIALYWSRAWENPQVVCAWRDLISNWPTVLILLVLLSAILFIVKKLNLTLTSIDHKSGEECRGRFVHGIIARIERFRSDLLSAAGFVLRRGKSSFAACVAVAGIGWCGRYGAISALIFGLGYPADPVLFFLLQWVVFTTMTMIPTPGAIGGAEVSFALAYRGLIPSAIIPIAASAWRFVTFYLTVGLGSLIFSLIGTEFADPQMARDDSAVLEKTAA